MGWEGVELVNLAQGRDKWWAVVNMVMNFIDSISVHREMLTLKQ